MKPSEMGCIRFCALPWVAKMNALLLCAAVLASAVVLWPEWRHDDELTHGIFLPFMAAILVSESRRDPAPRFLRGGPAAVSACAALLLAGLASLAVAMVYAAAMGWTHAMAEFMLSAALVFILGAAWLAFADRRVRLLPFNWTAAIAVVLWLFASPTPPGTYARLSSFLQSRVTGGVMHVLNALGIAAFQMGNVIELARTSVGVSEACSGIRSLVSCTVAGLFLSAALVRSPWHRAFVIGLSPVIGLAMNFLRSLLLTLLANGGVRIDGPWHDMTGASILVGTTLLVAALAWVLRRREVAPVYAPIDAASNTVGPPIQQTLIAAGLFLAAGTLATFAVAGSRSRGVSGPEPALAALLPAAPPGWTAQTTPDLEQYSGTLHTHALVERVYSEGPGLGSAHVTLYLAYWRPGEAPVSLVDAHTPDSCWPGTGWEAKPVPDTRSVLKLGGRMLAPAECRLFALNQFETRVWFWHLYGGRPVVFVDPHSAISLVKLAWHFGLGSQRDQLFVRVSSNRSWDEIAAEPILTRFFENLSPLGL